MDLFMMTGDSWAWFDASILEQADKDLDADAFQTIQVKWEDFRSEPTGLNSANAIGLNLYGTQVTGTITFDYIKGIKADGSTEIIDDFDKKPQLEGTDFRRKRSATTWPSWVTPATTSPVFRK